MPTSKRKTIIPTSSSSITKFNLGNRIALILDVQENKSLPLPYLKSINQETLQSEVILQRRLRTAPLQALDGLFLLLVLVGVVNRKGKGIFSTDADPKESAEAILDRMMDRLGRPPDGLPTVNEVGDGYHFQLKGFPDSASADQWVLERLASLPSGKDRRLGGEGGQDKQKFQTAVSDVKRQLSPLFSRELDWVGAVSAGRSVQTTFRTILAERLTPLFNDYVRAYAKAHPQNSIENKRALALEINEELRSLRLAISCPKTGFPAMLQVYVRGAGHTDSHYVLDVHLPTGGHKRCNSWSVLPEFELIEDIPRREGASARLRQPHSDQHSR